MEEKEDLNLENITLTKVDYLEYFNRLLEHQDRVQESMNVMLELSDFPNMYSGEELSDIIDEVKYLLGDE